jgi:hypothetical protein
MWRFAKNEMQTNEKESMNEMKWRLIDVPSVSKFIYEYACRVTAATTTTQSMYAHAESER